jgi:EmrB/QacA subfamily drug resistance transporter
VSGRAPLDDRGELPRWRVFVPLAIGVTMATLDISVVNIALPTLARTFRQPLTSIEWVVLAYVLVVAGLQLPLGRVADRVGRRRVYALGLAVFTVASGLCAAAPGAAWLVAARALQGLGAAMMTANSGALLIAAFPDGERGRALGAFGAAVGVGLGLGPPIGGLLVSHSWRWIFLLNLPLGVLAMIQLLRRVPPDLPAFGRRPALPVPSALLGCAVLVLTTLGLSRGPANGWSGAGVWLTFAAAALALAAFVAVERRVADPLVPRGVLGGPLGTGVLLTFIGQTLSLAVGFHMPLHFEEVLGFDAARSGRWLAVVPLVALVAAPLGGRGADAFGSRRLASLGLAIAFAGFVVLAGLPGRTAPLPILGGLALVGLGFGLFTAPNASAVMGAVPRDQLGVASGLQATMRGLGMTAGAALAAALLASRYTAHGGGVLRPGSLTGFDARAFTLAGRDLYVTLAVLTVAALFLARRHPGRE